MTRTENNIPVFDEYDIHKGDWSGAQWTFNCAMVSTCTPLFDDCDSNYEVRGKLKKAKVITKSCEDDTESCEMYVYFKSKATGLSFINRLNAYLAKKGEMLDAARRF